MRFRFITASSVSGRPFSGVFPPCRGGMLERKKAPSPAGAPTLLFCAPSRTALPRPMQRRSPPLCPFPMPLCAPTHNRGGSCLRTCRTAIGVRIRLPPLRPWPHGAPPSPFFSLSPFRSGFLFPPVLRRACSFPPPVGRPHIPSPSACTANSCVLLCHPLPVPAAGVGLRLPVPLYRPHASPPGHPFPFFVPHPIGRFRFALCRASFFYSHPLCQVGLAAAPCAAAARGSPSSVRPPHPAPSALFFRRLRAPLV